MGTRPSDEVWTFFPDPWRKARHRKRRLVSDNFALEIGRLLRDGGVWRLATDWDDYAWQMRDVIEACELFENPHAVSVRTRRIRSRSVADLRRVSKAESSRTLRREASMRAATLMTSSAFAALVVDGHS